MIAPRLKTFRLTDFQFLLKFQVCIIDYKHIATKDRDEVYASLQPVMRYTFVLQRARDKGSLGGRRGTGGIAYTDERRDLLAVGSIWQPRPTVANYFYMKGGLDILLHKGNLPLRNRIS